MSTKKDICEKIEELIPEAGKCGIDFRVERDSGKNAWVVDLHDDTQHLQTHIEDDEADTCLENDRCLSVGLQIGQLKRNLNLRHEALG